MAVDNNVGKVSEIVTCDVLITWGRCGITDNNKTIEEISRNPRDPEGFF